MVIAKVSVVAVELEIGLNYDRISIIFSGVTGRIKNDTATTYVFEHRSKTQIILHDDGSGENFGL